jgi:phosphoribosylanthranilate isomerase
VSSARAPQAKVCGLTRRADAEAAAASGVHFAGVVFAPGGSRTVGVREARELLSDLPVRRVGVFVNASLDDVLRAAEVAHLDVLQLHGDEDPRLIEQLRARGAPAVWKAIRPRAVDEFVAGLNQYQDLVDGLLVDGWSAEARGGTGRTFSWREIAPQRLLVPDSLSFIAAGGLHADNLSRAVAILSPDIVDVSSGVETSPGLKSPEEISRFMDVLRQPSPSQNDL